MNKLFTRIMATVAGFAMAIGVGVAANNKSATELNADVDDITLSSSQNCTVGGVAGVKANKGVAVTITLPKAAGNCNVSFYAAGWNGDGTVSYGVTYTNATSTTTSISVTNDSGIAGSSTAYTLNGTANSYNIALNQTSASSDMVITIGGVSGKRFVVWGASYESSGDIPELTPMSAPTISISGTVVSWANIEGNNGYSYSITGTETKNGNLEANTTSLDVSSLNLAYGNYSITVTTKGNGTSTSDSVASNAEAFVLSEPIVSGTFNKWTTSLVPGDYILTYGSVAMGNVVSNNKIQNSTLSFSSGASSISNPISSAVWTLNSIEENDTTYWTIYNAAAEKYVKWNSSTNVSLVDDVENNAKWTLVTDAATKDFQVYGDTRCLRSHNNVWSSYASSNGGPLTLYKKYIPYTISYNNNGGSGTMDNSETIVSACTFTAPDGKEFDHWNTAANDSGKSYNPNESVDSNCTLYAIWRNLVPSVEINKNSVNLTIDGDTSDTVIATLHNINNPTFVWSRLSGDDCVSLTNANTATVTISISNETTRVSKCVVRLTVNGKLGGNDIEPITKDVEVIVNRESTSLAPFTVAEAKKAIDIFSTIEDAYVAGVISQIDSFSSKYHSITYWISDDGTTTDQLEVYGGLGLNGANFSAITDLETGDSVVVKGGLTLFGGTTYEFNTNSEIVSRTPVTKYTVSFETNGGSAVESQRVVAGQQAQEPTAPTKPSTELYNYTFVAWYDNPELSGDPYVFSTPVTDNLVLYAKWNETEVPAYQIIGNNLGTKASLSYSNYAKHVSNSVVEDTLTRETTGKTGTNYGDWNHSSNVSGVSYSGNSAGGNDSIQLRSSSNSGIIVTANINNKVVKKITIVWNSGTPNGRVLDFYGKNTAYSATSELYGSSKGSSIGSLTLDDNENGLSKSIDISEANQFKYIGIRSNSSAHWIESIEIQWGESATYTYENLKIRFNGKVSESLWNRLDSESHIEGYGMLLTTSDVIDDDDLKDYYGAAINYTSSPDVTNEVVKFPSTKAVPNLSEGQYGWSLHKAIAAEDLTTTYVAVAYIITRDNGVVFLDEIRASAQSLAEDLLNNDIYEEDAFGGSLKYLANQQ